MGTDTVNVASSLYKNYIKKADECFESMNDAYQKSHWNVCVIAAVHCGINSADALTVKFKGIRHRGIRHDDVARLLNEIKLDDVSKKNRQLLNLLSLKSRAEYEPILISKSEADEAILNAERFYKWMKSVLQE
ncbi:HEPN domain-containing protein [Candidatus Woesearchaeota archaeon]|nr:HEPN domain-containing protein [Candidatus Woesearchaeota archaeon]